MTPNVECIADMHDQCGEAPTWVARSRRLLWVDCDSSRVHEYDVASGRSATINQGLMVACIGLNQSDSFVFAGAAGLHVWRAPGTYRTVVSHCDGAALNINDMIVDARGRIYAGTMYWGPDGMERTGGLYLVEPDETVRQVADDIHLSNGLGFSPDQRTLYHADTTRRRIYAYDVHPESGALHRRRVFAQVPADEGLPDGLTVDAEGCVWSAQWYGGQVVRYDPEGRVERRLRMPVLQVSSVTFGGDDLTDLYITSAGVSWRSPYAPPGYDFDAPHIGGALYRVPLGIPGRAEHVARFRV